MKYIFAYGTLRPGEPNFNKFKSLQHEATAILYGIQLFDLGPYPVADFTNSNNLPATGDFLSVSDEDFIDIDEMEMNAGYYSWSFSHKINGVNRNVIIWLMKKGDIEARGGVKIETNDWLNRDMEKDKVAKRKIFIADSQTGYARWMEGQIVKNIEDADLVLFTGGEDVDPSLYGEKEHYHTSSNIARDSREIEIYKKALSLGKQILGICRGSQFLCVMNGGKLVQHMQHAGSHSIELHEDIEDLVKKGQKIDASSTHHQMQYPFNLPQDEYQIIASNPDRSKMHLGGDNEDMNPLCDVEIAYYPKTKCLAIQMHPEYLSNNSFTIKCMRKLLDTVYERSNKQIAQNSEVVIEN